MLSLNNFIKPAENYSDMDIEHTKISLLDFLPLFPLRHEY